MKSNRIETNVYLVKKNIFLSITILIEASNFYFIIRSLLSVRESENSALALEYFVTNNETCIILPTNI